ncbi:uncharacterized protein MELLADRAFT_84906 [Melampsora larici-populina 98AG31]|uniref:DUF7872 domain-containing protein n=1 Tax=Melampsora larici-populina (strain 98AG31 / pathotype 3-4-7) TaxID=747676 RepID=F4RH74_MELLP|nr:uncharacterized protein MELLADRAFT_84906 [Melampsora larici-populina 98AG31]EGG08379.1 hypothetical protein MELLADRAFT_84906 [Melampsora larici-populina 98AG31]
MVHSSGKATRSIEMKVLLSTFALLSAHAQAANLNGHPHLNTLRPRSPFSLGGTAPASNVAVNTSCEQPDINNATWIQRGIDSYLESFPNGSTMSLQRDGKLMACFTFTVTSLIQKFAAHAGLDNFICGIGEQCHAGQICSPAHSPDWEVLVGAQEWNNFRNKLYEAVGVATQMVTSISGTLVSDLYPPAHKGELWDLMKTFTLASTIVATISLLSILAGVGSIIFIASSVALAVTGGIAGGIGVKLALETPEPDAFARWSNYAFYLSQWQQHVQKNIANGTRTVIESGVSTAQGISSVLKNGTFFYTRPEVNEAELISSLKNTTTARIVTDILRNQVLQTPTLCTKCSARELFLTALCDDVGTSTQDKCTGDGPGGAWGSAESLSYCSPNGTMMNIIHGGKKKVNNKWHNADLIYKKYGITVKYLVEQSWDCQVKHGGFSFDPYKSGSFPTDMNSECIANLPVCDLRQQGGRFIQTLRAERNLVLMS